MTGESDFYRKKWTLSWKYMEWIELMLASVTLLLWTGLRFYLLENVDMDEYWIAVGNSKPLMELVLQRQK